MGVNCWLAVLLALACLTVVSSEDMFNVSVDDDTCVLASLGDCVTCMKDGVEQSVMLSTYSGGVLSYTQYQDSQCTDVKELSYHTANECGLLIPCQAAPAGFSLFEVEASTPLRVSCLSGSNAVVSMNVSASVAAGSHELLVYHDEDSNSVQLVTLGNSTYTTTAGSCPYGTWCSAGDLRYRMDLEAFGPENSDKKLEILRAIHGLTTSGDAMVRFVTETYSYSLSTVDRNVFAVGQHGVSIPASMLPSAVLQLPIGYTLTNMDVNSDSGEPGGVPILSATVDWLGMGERDKEYECFFDSATSFLDPIIECSLSLPFEVTDEPRMFDSFADVFDAMNEERAWDERPAFTLFE